MSEGRELGENELELLKKGGLSVIGLILLGGVVEIVRFVLEMLMEGFDLLKRAVKKLCKSNKIANSTSE